MEALLFNCLLMFAFPTALYVRYVLSPHMLDCA